MSERGVRMVAVSAALVAVVMASVTSVIVIRRSSGSVERVAAGSGLALVKPPEAGDVTIHVAATEVVKLRREVVLAVVDQGATIGMKVTDGELVKQLGLIEGDVITALQGRPLKREFDVLDVMSGTGILDPKTIYVEVTRAGKPMLMRWAIDGDLRAARRAANDSSSTLRLPSVAPVADPLVATIVRVDDTHFEIPRTTADKLIADPMTYMKGARTYPSSGLSGSTRGFRLFAVRPQTVISAFGLANGDTIRGINGFDTPTLERFVEVLGQVKTVTSLTIDVERRGLPVLLTITVK